MEEEILAQPSYISVEIKKSPKQFSVASQFGDSFPVPVESQFYEDKIPPLLIARPLPSQPQATNLGKGKSINMRRESDSRRIQRSRPNSGVRQDTSAVDLVVLNSTKFPVTTGTNSLNVVSGLKSQAVQQVRSIEKEQQKGILKIQTPSVVAKAKSVVITESSPTKTSKRPTSAMHQNISTATVEASTSTTRLKSSEVINQTLSERDQAALQVGRMIVGTILGNPEVTTADVLSRFFFDNWLSKQGSSTAKADLLSVDLLCELQRYKTAGEQTIQTNMMGLGSQGDNETIATNEIDEALTELVAKERKVFGAAAFESLGRLANEYQETAPVLREIMSALIPMMFTDANSAILEGGEEGEEEFNAIGNSSDVNRKSNSNNNKDNSDGNGTKSKNPTTSLLSNRYSGLTTWVERSIDLRKQIDEMQVQLDEAGDTNIRLIEEIELLRANFVDENLDALNLLADEVDDIPSSLPDIDNDNDNDTMSRSQSMDSFSHFDSFMGSRSPAREEAFVMLKLVHKKNNDRKSGPMQFVRVRNVYRDQEVQTEESAAYGSLGKKEAEQQRSTAELAALKSVIDILTIELQTLKNQSPPDENEMQKLLRSAQETIDTYRSQLETFKVKSERLEEKVKAHDEERFNEKKKLNGIISSLETALAAIDGDCSLNELYVSTQALIEKFAPRSRKRNKLSVLDFLESAGLCLEELVQSSDQTITKLKKAADEKFKLETQLRSDLMNRGTELFEAKESIRTLETEMVGLTKSLKDQELNLRREMDDLRFAHEKTIFTIKSKLVRESEEAITNLTWKHREELISSNKSFELREAVLVEENSIKMKEANEKYDELDTKYNLSLSMLKDYAAKLEESQAENRLLVMNWTQTCNQLKELVSLWTERAGMACEDDRYFWILTSERENMREMKAGLEETIRESEAAKQKSLELQDSLNALNGDLELSKQKCDGFEKEIGHISVKMDVMKTSHKEEVDEYSGRIRRLNGEIDDLQCEIDDMQKQNEAQLETIRDQVEMKLEMMESSAMALEESLSRVIGVANDTAAINSLTEGKNRVLLQKYKDHWLRSENQLMLAEDSRELESSGLRIWLHTVYEELYHAQAAASDIGLQLPISPVIMTELHERSSVDSRIVSKPRELIRNSSRIHVSNKDLLAKSVGLEPIVKYVRTTNPEAPTVSSDTLLKGESAFRDEENNIVIPTELTPMPSVASPNTLGEESRFTFHDDEFGVGKGVGMGIDEANIALADLSAAFDESEQAENLAAKSVPADSTQAESNSGINKASRKSIKSAKKIKPVVVARAGGSKCIAMNRADDDVEENEEGEEVEDDDDNNENSEEDEVPDVHAEVPKENLATKFRRLAKEARAAQAIIKPLRERTQNIRPAPRHQKLIPQFLQYIGKNEKKIAFENAHLRIMLRECIGLIERSNIYLDDLSADETSLKVAREAIAHQQKLVAAGGIGSGVAGIDLNSMKESENKLLQRIWEKKNSLKHELDESSEWLFNADMRTNKMKSLFGEPINPLQVMAHARKVELYDEAAKDANEKGDEDVKETVDDVQQALRDIINLNGGWKGVLYRADGTMDLELPLSPWTDEEKIEILVNKLHYARCMWKTSTEKSAMEIERLKKLLEATMLGNTEGQWDLPTISANIGVETALTLEKDLQTYQRVKKAILEGKIECNEVIYTENDIQLLKKAIVGISDNLKLLCSQGDSEDANQSNNNNNNNITNVPTTPVLLLAPSPVLHSPKQSRKREENRSIELFALSQDSIKKVPHSQQQRAASARARRVEDDPTNNNVLLGRIRPPKFEDLYEPSIAKKAVITPLITNPTMISNTGAKSFVDDSVQPGWRHQERLIRAEKSALIQRMRATTASGRNIQQEVQPSQLLLTARPISAQPSTGLAGKKKKQLQLAVSKSQQLTPLDTSFQLQDQQISSSEVAVKNESPSQKLYVPQFKNNAPALPLNPLITEMMKNLSESCNQVKSRLLFGVRCEASAEKRFGMGESTSNNQFNFPVFASNLELSDEDDNPVDSRNYYTRNNDHAPGYAVGGGIYNGLYEQASLDMKARKLVKPQKESEKEVMKYAKNLNQRINKHIAAVKSIETELATLGENYSQQNKVYDHKIDQQYSLWGAGTQFPEEHFASTVKEKYEK